MEDLAWRERTQRSSNHTLHPLFLLTRLVSCWQRMELRSRASSSPHSVAISLVSFLLGIQGPAWPSLILFFQGGRKPFKRERSAINQTQMKTESTSLSPGTWALLLAYGRWKVRPYLHASCIQLEAEYLALCSFIFKMI